MAKTDTNIIGRALDYTLANDRERVQLTLGGQQLTMSTDEIDWLVGALGELRAEMNPPVPQSIWGSGARVANLQALNICDLEQGAPYPLERGALVTARSAYFGWQQFVVSPDVCMGLAAWLTGQRENLPKATPGH